MDTLLKVLQTPMGTILAFAGIIIVFFAFFEVAKGTVKMRKKPKEGTIPASIGAVLIIGGLILSNAQTATVGEPTPANSTPTMVVSTEVSPVLPTETAVAPTETSTPTSTPVTPTLTASSVPVHTIVDDCIDAQTWTADSSDAGALDAIVKENNCWNLENLGLTVQDGTLHILPRSSSVQTSSGIYTAVTNQSVIEFKVFVKSLYLVYKDNPAYISFSIAPQSEPMARRNSGRFKLQIKDTGNLPLVLFVLADTTEANGTELGTQHYLYGRTYDIRLVLKGIFMEVYINGVDTRETISLPSGPKVFYIGYNLPVLAGADVEISNIVVDGVSK
jgi:hypothetical protein